MGLVAKAFSPALGRRSRRIIQLMNGLGLEAWKKM